MYLSDREEGREGTPSSWLTPQMPSSAGAEPRRKLGTRIWIQVSQVHGRNPSVCSSRKLELGARVGYGTQTLCQAQCLPHGCILSRINTVVLYDKLDRRSLNCMQCFKWLHLTFTNEDAIQGRTITKQSSLLNGHHTTEVTPPDACWKTMKTACADTSCCWFVETNTSHTNH